MKIFYKCGISIPHNRLFISFRPARVCVLLAFISLFLAGNVTAQTKNVSLNFSNTPINEILISIEKQTDLSFFYTDELDLSQKVSIVTNNESINSVLEKIFTGKAIRYNINDKRIVLYKQDLKRNAVLQPVTAKTDAKINSTISGKVLDEKGEPFPGVSVIVKGTRNGITTELDGSFSIQASRGSILEFSFIGYSNQNQRIEGNTGVIVTMKPDAALLEEVIVTGVAAATTRAKLSFTVEKVKGDLLTQVPAISAATALQGKVAGVKIITTSGNPNSEPVIQLRGTASFTGNSAPLVIVDGILTAGGLKDINAEDIESMEVIKGAAAASFYGSRAANGVISITTKRGSSLEQGKTIFQVRSELGVSWQTFTPQRTTAHGHKLDENGNPTRELDDDQVWDNPYIMNADPFKDVFRPSLYSSNQISVQGNAKSGNMSYYGSYQYQDNKGIVNLLNGVQRSNLRLNLDHRITDHLSVSVSNGFILKTVDERTPNFDDIFYADPNADFLAKNLDGSDYKINPNIVSTRTNPNILYQIANSFAESKSNRYLGAYKLTYTPVSSVILNAVYSLDFENSSLRRLNPAGNLQSTHPDGSVRTTGDIFMSNSRNAIQNFSLDGLFSKKIGDFTTRYKMQYVYESNNYSSTSASGSKLVLNGMNVISLELASPDTRDHNSYTQTIVNKSVTALAYADYKDKYIFDALIRRDGSSLFGENERWQTYFRVSGAWNVVKDFEIPHFDYLKPRISYGTAGLLPEFADQYETFSLENGKLSGGEQLGNKNLKPAFSQEFEIGVDGKFLERFDFSLSYSHKRNTNQIFSIPVSAAVTGFQYQTQNVGEFFIKSWELSFNANIITKPEFSWDANFTWDKIDQRVGELGRDQFKDGAFTRVESNTRWGDMYSTAFATSLDEVKSSTLIKEGQTVEDVFTINNYGWVVRKDQIGTRNETKMFVLDDKGNNKEVFIGNPTPDFTTNLTNTFRYKHWQLYFTLTWQQGGEIYNNTKVYMSAAGRNARFWDMSDRPWEQRKALAYVNQHARKSFTEDVSFLKMRELAVSYVFSKNQLAQYKLNFFNQIRVSAIARNLFTLTNFSGPEPETRNISERGTALGEDTPKYPGGAAFFSGSIIIDF